MNQFNPPKYIKMSLDNIDGNAFAIMAAFKREAKEQGWSSEDIEKVLTRAKSGNYSNLIITITAHIQYK